ncbi:MAG TPA: DUF885 domain-containing protein [Acidobacteriota bacterium]|nr:DUF885 domain-containing protein [Acidobacteriota bacterium]
MKKIFCLLAFALSTFTFAADIPPNAKLRALFDEEWEFRLKENPLMATNVGIHTYDDKLPSVTEADWKRRAEASQQFLNRLHEIEATQLNNMDRINYELFETQLKENVAEFEFRTYLIPWTADSGFHTEFARLSKQMLLMTSKDYENYIARMNAFPAYVSQYVEILREAIKTGMTLPAAVLDGYEVSMSTHVVDDPTKSVFYAPFQSFPVSVNSNDQERLRKEGTAAIQKGVVPGYKALLDFFVNEYRPKARKTLGASEWPNGRKLYEHLVRSFTTLNLTPEEVHETGLREVDRIQKEMNEIIQKVGFIGDFAAFLKFLRTDPRFYPKTAEELLKDASYIAKKMDGKLPLLFKTLPRLPYGVEPVPPDIAPKYTAGRYVGPAEGSTEPGYYWVNTYKLDSRTLYTLEALTLHEAVPGHHLQTALASELKDVPEFRRFMYLSAFGEGWGLYSEHLGREAGFYTDPYSDFGRLTYEMWRACRLVVDTGLHSKGWMREQALEYLGSHTALSLLEVQTETDRYISWPGQALAYKIGELKIKELRKKAETELGTKFNIREFHDAVLLNGSVSLPILERQINEYIAKTKQS